MQQLIAHLCKVVPWEALARLKVVDDTHHKLIQNCLALVEMVLEDRNSKACMHACDQGVWSRHGISTRDP